MSRLCLVTNATARSICWHIIVYMREKKNLSPDRIVEIKEKLNFHDIDDSPFEIDDLIKSFQEKNIYFLMLYSHLKEENRYLNLLNNLNNNQRLSNYFPNRGINEIYDDYQNRRIYHSSIFCKWITNDYIDENRIALNTGIYANNYLSKNASYYKIDEDYLQKLNLEECNICTNNILRSCVSTLNIFEIFSFIKNSNRISLSYEIIKENPHILNLLLNKGTNAKIEVFLHENEWTNININPFINSNFILRLVHNKFTFFENKSIIILNDKLYFYYDGEICVPNEDYINTSAFNLLNYNTVVLSQNEILNSNYTYNVPVTYCFSSNDEVFGEQTIVQIEIHGLKSLITLKCNSSEVPKTILGYWLQKSEFISNINDKENFNHNYFGFKCTDEKVLKFL